MTTPVQTLRQTLRVSGVSKITVSAIVPSDTPGQQLRAVRFHTDDPAVPTLEVQIEGASADLIRFTTPELDY